MRSDDRKTMMSEESAQGRNLLGSFIRAQRQMANLSLRELSAMTEVSNPYLSQIERGLSEPSARVLKSIAQALNLSAEALFAQAGLIPEWTRRDDDATETALRTDPRLTEPQKRALLAVYRSYIGANGQGTADDAADN
jgi:transcriptional regulator with XRE-family HTH domain